MSDLLTRNEPVSEPPFAAEGVTVSLAPPMARFSLRARQAQALETLLGVKVPKRIGATEGGIACLGPDEWLLRAAAGSTIAMGENLPIAIVDISDRALCFIVEGTRAAEVLMSGCPLDLDSFAVGRATRTLYETVEIILIREAEHRFHVEVWRSFAPWLWMAVTTAAEHLDIS
jgi:sarcosine oxidase, subunit gamma